MSSTRDKIAKASLAIAGMIFHIACYVCVAVLLFWLGQTAYRFGYNVFNQHAMNPGAGTEVTVVVRENDSVLKIGRTLESKGLIEDAYVFVVQEFLSDYKGELKPGTYLLSTAYTPGRIMSIMAGEEVPEEESPT